MKIVNIIGGLGNQMFQYAFALALQKKHKEDVVKIDTTHFNYFFIKKYKSANLHNGYEIEKVFPNAKIQHATPWDLMRQTWYMPNYVLSRVVRRLLPVRKHEYIQKPKDIFAYSEDIFNAKGDGYYEGVWQAVDYYSNVKDELRGVFAHPAPNEYNKKLINEIMSSNSVGLHVRRGDYLAAPEFNGICDLDYYKKGIAEILKDNQNHDFYIFSNDIPWCKQEIEPLINGHNIIYVTENTGKNSCWDMFLMTYCKDLIIANSSFSWWGAFLNKKARKVIVPQRWVNREGKQENYCKEWIKV
jgi:hypothetical protein